MANQSVQDGRAWFEKELRTNANKENLPIDTLQWDDIPRKDESQLVVTSNGKRKEFQIDNLQLESEKTNSDLRQRIEEIVASLS